MKKQDAERRKKRRRFSKILKLLKYAAAIAAIFAAICTFFKISDIQVEGNVIYSKEEIISASGIDTGGSLFFAGKRAAGRRIYEKLACIDRADIRVKAPGTVIISVSEADAAACLEYEGMWLLLSRSYKVLSTGDSAQLMRIYGLTPDKPEEGAVLTVIEEDKNTLRCAIELTTLLEEENMADGADWMDLTNMTNIRIHYRDSYTINFGAYENLDYKLGFARSIMKELGAGEKGVIDLSGETEGHYIPR